MLLTIGLIVAGALLVGVAIYWENLLNWVRRVLNKLKERLKNAIEGVRTFIVKTKEGIKNCTKSYSRNKISGEWEENLVLKQIDPSELPEEIRNRIQNASIGSQLETTEELAELLA